MAQEIVPMKWLVGIRSRSQEDKLAYFTYLEKNGKINSETSWQNWRDKKIKAIEFNNDLIDGWKIDNDFNQRYGQSNRKLFIIVEPRTGYMFELDVRDILPMLQNIKIVDGVIQGKYCLTKTKTLMSEKEFKALSDIKPFEASEIQIGDKIAFGGKELALGIYNIYLGKMWSYDIETEYTKDGRDWDHRYIKEQEQFIFINYKNNETHLVYKSKLPKECTNVGKGSEIEIFKANEILVKDLRKLHDIFFFKNRLNKFELCFKPSVEWNSNFWQIDDKMYQSWYRPNSYQYEKGVEATRVEIQNTKLIFLEKKTFQKESFTKQFKLCVKKV